MDAAYSDVIRRLASAYFADTLMNSFMSQLDEVLVNRVRRVEREMGNTTSRFSALRDMLAELEGDFSRKSAETRESVEKITEMNDTLARDLEKSGTDLQGMSENVGRTVDATYGTLQSFLDIEKMSKEIQRIAKQTNLLALNASIEAARAGEHGRGFAIVARNVQELAAETKTASESITTKVTEISSSVQEAMDDIRRVTGMFDVIRTSLASFTEFLATNKGFMERMEAAMTEAGGTIRRSSDEMEDSVRVMGEASVQFESMAATISAIVLAQKNLKSIRL